jgi:hypothetical protein
MKNCILILSLVFLLACEKEYFPDPNAYRDKALFGTWLYINNTESYPVLKVFTEDGYMGKVFFTNNYSSANSLGAIYSTNSDNDIIYEHSQFRKGIYSREVKYRTITYDTLLLEKKLDEQEWDTLVRYRYQLKYDGPKYVGLDSIN